MVSFRQRFLSDMTRVASIISSSVLPRNAREKVKRVFAATWTRRITLLRPTSRVTQLSALVRMLSRPHSKRHSPEGVMDQYSQCSLAKVNNLLKYLTADKCAPTLACISPQFMRIFLVFLIELFA
jgi:hypothetical protein